MNAILRFWVVGILGLVIILGVGVVSLVVRSATPGTADVGVHVVDPGSPTREFATASEAEAHVADLVGFNEIVPDVIPDGLQPATLALSPQPRAGAPTLRRVTVEFEGPKDRSMRLLAVGRTFDFPGRDPQHHLARLGEGADLYRSDDADGVRYTLVTADRGWVASVPVGSTITEEEVTAMLQSLLKS